VASAREWPTSGLRQNPLRDRGSNYSQFHGSRGRVRYWSNTDGIGTGKLRRAVALLNGIFTTLGLEKHPNKTFIGRVEKGFDFLGYCLWPDRLTVAQATVERFLARVTRLYEQEQGRPLRSAPLGSYVRRWVRWTGAGVPPSRSGYLSV